MKRRADTIDVVYLLSISLIGKEDAVECTPIERVLIYLICSWIRADFCSDGLRCSFIWTKKGRKCHHSQRHAMDIPLVDIVEGLFVPLKCKTTVTITVTATANNTTDNSTILTKQIIDPYSNRFFRSESELTEIDLAKQEEQGVLFDWRHQ